MHRSRHHRNKDKDTNRFYLLPGQGGRLYRKKQKLIIAWSLFAALLVSGIVVSIMYFTDHF